MSKLKATLKAMHRAGKAASSKKREAKKLSGSSKFEKVMHEWGQGELKSGGSGKKVTNQKQALAIAFSEARRAKKKKG